MSRRTSLAALAAVIAALALAVPVASASAATTPAARTASLGFGGHLVSGSLPCQILVAEIRTALQFGNTVGANFLSRVLQYSGCGGAAI